MDISDANSNVATTNVTVTTTTETVAVTSDPAALQRQVARVLIIGWLQLTAGTGTTAVTPRIRRGSAATGTLVGEGNALTAAAGNNVELNIIAQEERTDVKELTYSLTVEQTGASANGTVLQAGILVLVLS